jgi:radical SAM superfamily enzyme YgiQ (UPF0313 family)
MNPALSATTILLATLNAKFIHTSLGLRYLLANMGNFRENTQLREFSIARKPQEIVDELLKTSPTIIGFGVYIWNVTETTEVIRLIKASRHDIIIILGGPEVSYETNEQTITQLADYVITGWGDISFAKLCDTLLSGEKPLHKITNGEQPALNQIRFPYAEYTDDDLAHRLLYVEASRGCPFKCEFCLSALDKTAWSFDLEAFLEQMATLYQRGARHFKFVDRTFNLKTDTSIRILQFFLHRLTEDPTSHLFVHFEVIPDHLPEELKSMIMQFPPGTLQFEIGIQSFNQAVQQRISRRQNNQKTAENLRWLLAHSKAHLHADLIFGLPGETIESFAAGFDHLYTLGPHEIQLGILKRLRGSPIARHSGEYGMVYDPAPPYSIQQNSDVGALTVQRFTRFARYWDMIANSGRFRQTVVLLLSNPSRPSPFNAFMDFSDWLWEQTGKTNGLTPEWLTDALFDYLCNELGYPVTQAKTTLLNDYVASGARGNPSALKDLLPKRPPIPKNNPKLTARQTQHLH